MSVPAAGPAPDHMRDKTRREKARLLARLSAWIRRIENRSPPSPTDYDRSEAVDDARP